MVDYILTAHAETVMAARAIKREWVARVLSQPELTEPDNADPQLTHALAKIPEYGGRVLRVVYNGLASPKRVVTAYFDRAMKGKL